LHVAIDGRELVGKPTGVGRYVREVLRAWQRAGISDRYSIVIPTEPPGDIADADGRISWVVEPADFPGTWWEQTRLRRVVNRLSPDVLFAAGYTAPLFVTCPVVLAVYDVSFCAHPEWFSFREGARRRWLTRASARRARAIVTISEFSKQEIVRWLGVPADRITLAPPGAPDVPPQPAADRPPVVLFVGSLFNRRRIPELLAGFALTARRVPDARLVLVGDNRTSPRQDPLGLARDLGIGDRVEWHAYVDDGQLEAFYRRARVFAFLSDYEGFGMTPLEALAQGAPPVVLDTPLSREVYGAGAQLVTADAESIADALTALLTDPEARDALLIEGRRQMQRYSWERTAATLADLLRRAADR
jgi:glycosyltransferase involved in cell wall biosynthesis